MSTTAYDPAPRPVADRGFPTPPAGRDDGFGRFMLNKVPEVTLAFWIIKMMSTTVGETGADFLIFNANLGLVATSWIMSGLLAAVLLVQLRLCKYVPASYWLAVVMVSIVGTLVSDYLVDERGLALPTATLLFGAALATTFALWYAVERTLSIHAITTTRRELFYWAAILCTFALGTAAGDWLAESVGLGYATSAALFAVGIAAVYGAYRAGLNPVLAFWVAYVLTRPFGASMGDLLSQPTSNGGLGLGTVGTSAVFLVVIAALVGWLTMREHRANAGRVVVR